MRMHANDGAKQRGGRGGVIVVRRSQTPSWVANSSTSPYARKTTLEIWEYTHCKSFPEPQGWNYIGYSFLRFLMGPP